MSGHERPAPYNVPVEQGRFYNATSRRMEVEREEGRKAGSKVPPAKRKAKRRRKK
jgi:hypothetical protein